MDSWRETSTALGQKKGWSILFNRTWPAAFVLLSLTGCPPATIRIPTAPCKPAAESAPLSDHGTLTVAWDSSKEEVAGYIVYYGLSPRSYTHCVNIGKPPEKTPGVIQTTLKGLEKGKKYYVVVTAYDKNGDQSGFSTEISGVAK